MNIGTRLHAPNGCSRFPSSEEFYFLSSMPNPQRVLLVHFLIQSKTFGKSVEKATLFQWPRFEFEEECLTERIKATTEQLIYPPWLTQHGSLDQFVENHPSLKGYIAFRGDAVDQAVAQWPMILQARDPERHLNKIAKSLNIPAHRYRLWVYTFIIFGSSRLALTPAFSNVGRWDRPSKATAKKLGRPDLSMGRAYGTNLDESQLQKIDRAYKKYSELGRSLKLIYRMAMLNEWKCKVVKMSASDLLIVHPLGEPFPTFHQFRRRCLKTFGKQRLQIDRYGAERVRQKLAGNLGSFVEGSANLMEAVESDCFVAEEVPTAVDGTNTSSLFVVRVRDRTSGLFVGIGFSLGSERQSAYAMAAFCMCISKVLFCALFGLTITHDEWPSEGVPGIGITDRGSGAGLSAIVARIRELAQSYSGQSKAHIETSHEKPDKLQGAPTHKVSRKNPIQMAVVWILKTIAANKSLNVKSRLTPGMRAECELSSPLSVFEYLDRRGRNSAFRIPFDHAVKSFLLEKDATITADGVRLRGTIYTSTELKKSDLLARAKQHVISTWVYVMPFCVRHIWISVQGKLLQLTLQILIASPDEARELTFDDLCILEGRDSLRESKMRKVKDASALDVAVRYQNTFGEPYDNSQVRPGRPKSRAKRRVNSQPYEDIT